MPSNPTQLAAEALAAVSGGIQRILQERPRPLTTSDAEKALAMGEKVTADLRRFLKTEAFEDQEHDEGERDYWATRKLVTAEVPPDRLDVLTANITATGLAAAYGKVIDNGLAHLRKQLPAEETQTLLGPMPLLPDRVALAAYWRLWAVAKDPREVILRLREGVLVSDEVMGLQALYPATYDAFVATVLEQMAEAGGDTPDDGAEPWLPPLRKERQIEILLGITTIDPNFAAELQRLNEAARQSREVRTRPLEIDVKDMQTPTQRITAR